MPRKQIRCSKWALRKYYFLFHIFTNLLIFIKYFPWVVMPTSREQWHHLLTAITYCEWKIKENRLRVCLKVKLVTIKVVLGVFPFSWLSKSGLSRLVWASLPHRKSQNSLGDNHIFLSSELEESLLWCVLVQLPPLRFQKSWKQQADT